MRNHRNNGRWARCKYRHSVALILIDVCAFLFGNISLICTESLGLQNYKIHIIYNIHLYKHACVYACVYACTYVYTHILYIYSPAILHKIVNVIRKPLHGF